jgi:predicted kinase
LNHQTISQKNRKKDIWREYRKVKMINNERLESGNKKHLICNVGLPRSGKTTWSKSMLLPIVNKDAIRLALHGQRYIQESEGWVHQMALTMIKSLFLAGHDTVILDATNITKKRRDDWLSDDWDTHFKLFNTSKEVCIERAMETFDYVIIPVIERMSDQWEKEKNDST